MFFIARKRADRLISAVVDVAALSFSGRCVKGDQ